MSKEERELKVLRKAFKKATDLLDEVTGNGDLPCPMEYLGRCACISTDIGFECPDDTNANWAYAIKEKIETDEVNHEQVQGSIEQYYIYNAL